LRHALNRKEEALRVFERAAAVDPDAKDIQNQLGFLYLGIGRYDDAIAAHQRYAQLAPNEANAHDSLGMTFNETGRYDDAMASFNRALALNPDFHFAIRHLGDTYFHLGRYRAALGEYQRYLKVAPSDWDRAMASNLIARVHLAQGNVKGAEAAARMEGKYHNDFGGRMLAALARDDLETAGNLHARLAENKPDPRSAFEPRMRLYLLGAYTFKKGRIDDALKQLEEARRLYTFYWNIDTEADCLARAFYELGRLDEAISEYERLLKINPNWAPGQYRVARAYERGGDRERACAAYRSFLQIWKDADANIPEVVEARSKTVN
jgi:tetratricopeptide (TPR) repeat protein